MNRLKMVIAAGLLGMCSVASAKTPPPDGDAPAGGDSGRHRGPPPEAIAACADKPVDNVCSFTNRKGDAVTGRCEAPRRPPSSTDSSTPPPLACRGNRPPPPGAPAQ